jgi:hypothetical protein
MSASEEELLTRSLRMLSGGALNDTELEPRVAGFEVALLRLRHDPAEASRIDSLVIDAERARQDDRAIGGTRTISDGTEKAADRHRHWRLQGTWLAFGGILAGVSAAVAWAATASSSMIVLFIVGALAAVLAGGALCDRYLRASIADDIGPQLRRLHADIDPQLGRMRNQLDVIEYAVNLAVASRDAKLSLQPWPPPYPIPGQPEL